MYILSRTVSKLLQIIGQICAKKLETCGVDMVTDDYFILSLSTHLADRWLDGQTDGQKVNSNNAL